MDDVESGMASAMTTAETLFIPDDVGRRIAVLIGIDRYRQLLEVLEDIEAIRAYDEAKGSCDEAVLFEEATQEIERNRTAGFSGRR